MLQKYDRGKSIKYAKNSYSRHPKFNLFVILFTMEDRKKFLLFQKEFFLQKHYSGILDK
ncbi:hypothetical protein AB434_0375 [Heyndrickxia coagulans]|uniref:Uncharacterized protein n=1 Tax=Heyndrickxia coagulans TaxID=1398 RepID=A0AAN0T5Z5_HEYCO|nr:hypothetical protein SB48_HM08orf01251 [Heyndrickxia coagulans]AKN52780.1 hypothetical protein AB434_0375 [Heyndrickxia coagulans]KYC60162.1 hypothetical protein B4100_2110 [Heyndrickxia coagulans]